MLDWPVIRWPNRHEASLTNCDWKLATIELATQGRPTAWIDDNIGERARAWAQSRDCSHAPTLVVKTEGHVCLQDEHVELLLDWASVVVTGQP